MSRCSVRTTPTQKEVEKTLFGDYETQPRQLQLALAWTLFLAGTAAEQSEQRQKILNEMIRLVVLEESLKVDQALPNDGKRARALLRRLIEERRELRTSFHREAEATVLERLAELAGDEPVSDPEWAATQALASVMLAIERHDSWSEGHTFHFSRANIQPDGVLSLSRTTVRKQVWSVVEGDGPVGNRQKAWRLVDEAHSQANQARNEQIWRDEVVDDFRRIIRILKRDNVELSDLQGARSVWDWHVQFDKDPEVKALADQCEDLYSAHPSLEGIAWIFKIGWKDDEALEARRTAIERVLADGTQDAVERFLVDALEAATLGTQQQDRRWRKGIVLNVAHELGMHAQDVEGIRQCADGWIALDSASDRFLLACQLFRGQAFAARREGDDPVPRIREALAATCPKARGQLLRELYAASSARITLELMATELDLLEKKVGNELAAEEHSTWFIIARCIGLDSARVLALIERHWDAIPLEKAQECFRAVISGIRDRAMFKDEPLELETAVWHRIMALLVQVPEIDRLGGNLQWELRDLAKSWGKLPLSWLVAFLKARRALARTVEEPKLLTDQRYHTLPHRGEFFDLIERPEESDRSHIEELFEWRGDDSLTRYWLPQTLSALDPEGVVVPSLVAEASNLASTTDDLFELALFGGNFVEGTAPWRSIGTAVLSNAERLSIDSPDLYSELTWKGITSFGGPSGEVSPHWINDVERVRARLESETITNLKDYWQWRLEIAEARLEHERAKLAEEHGE